MKKRIFGMDFIRAIGTCLIFTYHFNVLGRHVYPDTLFFRNIDFGSLGVSLFLILSGAGLWISEKEEFSVWKYAKKRFLSILPLFWIAYVFARFNRLVFFGNEFGGIPKSHYLYTLIGMDGWLSYRTPTYYITGEWYLGCLLVLYLLYPLLRRLVRRWDIPVLVAAAALSLALESHYRFQMPLQWNPLIRLPEFVFGMVLARRLLCNEGRPRRRILAISGLFSLYFLFFYRDQISFWHIVPKQIFIGCLLFVFLYEVGELLKQTAVTGPVKILSRYSYAIFLVHRPINDLLATCFRDAMISPIHHAAVYVFYLMCIFAAGRLIFEVHQWMRTQVLRGITVVNRHA